MTLKEELKESILNLISSFWPITTKDVLKKLKEQDMKEDEVLLNFKELEKEEKIVVRENDEGIFAWPIEVDRFIKS